jgi:hypothetical protein
MKTFKTILIFVLLVCLNLEISPQFNNGKSPERNQLSESADKQVLHSGCTVFTISKDGLVFFGGNDDYTNPDSYYWVDPGDSSKYGVIWIGEPDNVQQGVNEKGLAYDANGLPRVEVNPHNERIPVSVDYSIYPILLMHECATVNEVINWISTHRWHSYMHDQMQFADATGDAVIISAGKDGEVVFTRKPAGDGFIVSTNFNVANPSNGYGYPDPRYITANEMLDNIINRAGPPSFKDATDVLNAVHVDKGASWTIESLAADLVNGIVYLYYFYQYDSPVILNVKQELANPREAGALSRLFPEEVRKTAAIRYRQIMFKAKMYKIIGITWAALILASITLIFTIFKDRKRGLKYWFPAVVILGPIALIIRFFAQRNQKKDMIRKALVETGGDLMPVVFSYTVALTSLIMITLSRGAGQGLQAGMMLGLPLLIGWLIFHVPALSTMNIGRYLRFLIQRLPLVLVTTFLGLAGILVIALPTVNHSLQGMNLIPLSLWSVMAWWAIVMVGGLGGGILIFLFESWSVKKGFSAWVILSGEKGEVVTPSWGVLWWWILLSIAVLLAGLVITIKLLN